MTSCGADTLANTLLPSLLAGKSFPITPVDLTSSDFSIPAESGPLFGTITKLDNAALTTGIVGGTGTFDALMGGFDAHLKREYEANRIAGADYAKAYVALTEAAMGNAVQYLLGRENAYWQAVAAQLQAQAQQVALVTARVQLETAKAQLQAQSYEALTLETTYAISKLKLATEDATYCTAKFNLDNLLPQQLKLVQEQAEAQRAQTSDTRTDGVTPITGLLGKQKDLYNQQITSYQRDAEVKAAKLFTDAWITQKTIDEGLLAPTGFQNTSVDTILTKIKTANGLT